MKKKVCLICGEELIYFEKSHEMECYYCHQKFVDSVQCANGHYVCDACREKQAIEDIKRIAKTTQSKNPVEIAVKMMKTPFVHMHGPEHHILIGSALLSAYHNAGGKTDFENGLNEMVKRGKQMPGGTCGFWGCCGAATSTGMFMSIVTGATPLSEKPVRISMQTTTSAMQAIAEIGGPRCCKRNGFLAIEQAVKQCREQLGIEMELPEKYICEFSSNNPQCIGKRCPYNLNH